MKLYSFLNESGDQAPEQKLKLNKNLSGSFLNLWGLIERVENVRLKGGWR